MFQNINDYAARSVSLTAEETALFNEILEYRKIPKKTRLLTAGDVCNFEAYVNKGCIREYIIDENGAEVTLQFAIEDWWVSDLASFQDQSPAHMNIETLEDCELLILTRDSKEKLLNEVPKLERMFRLMLQRHLTVVQKRLFKTISTTAMEKYLEFINRYPSIPQRVPQHYIASYLGISPEFLSKLRTRSLKK
ncbi:Crp/Fnr family transcriptional regulator [Mucilaginibacter gossypii]|uniref:Crp/Fnr family transcriptional regulator n=1 Tax=Mucilaginibacter gossypii TaxID=551996 RepID=UPI000DCDE315|nr:MULTISPECIES: Crp/Fnr family transcriptional regulator [Mucilaginibacter]QTE37655.1 Crp/Fnr family transcriptional regulator [Mucilaginibacter gossypii]RAV46957.1 Crp/Fnr family transcriptional regulator [Mucilaginibacter rubeus]